MLLDQDKDIVSQSETDLKIYQRALKYAKSYLISTRYSHYNNNHWGELIEIRFVQDLGLAKPGFLPNGMKYKDSTLPLYTSKYFLKTPTVKICEEISVDFAERVLNKAKELKAIDIIIGYHYS